MWSLWWSGIADGTCDCAETFLMNVEYVVAQVLLKANVIVLETFLMNVEFVEAQVLLKADCDCAGNVLR